MFITVSLCLTVTLFGASGLRADYMIHEPATRASVDLRLSANGTKPPQTAKCEFGVKAHIRCYHFQ